MKIVELNLNNKSFKFTKGYNLIYSSENGIGKTTLIRAVLYAMGFNIPATKGIHDFTHINTKIVIKDNGIVYIIKRKLKDIYLYSIKHNKLTLILQGKAFKKSYDIHSTLFNTSNPHIIYNILGCSYFDQEKGWTLLNRGRVIGGYHFDINDYMSSFIPPQVNTLKFQFNKLTKENRFYRHLSYLIEDAAQSAPLDSEDMSKNKLNSSINTLNLYLSKLKSQIKQLKLVDNSNDNFINVLSSLGLVVNNGHVSIPVNKGTLKNFDINEDFIRIRLNNLYSQFRIANRKKTKLYNKFNELFNPKLYANKIKGYVKNISNSRVKSIIAQNTHIRKRIKNKITKLLIHSDKTTMLFNIIRQYAKELGVYKYILISNEDTKNLKDPRQFIYTRQLKGFSGSVLHLLVFVFRLSCLKMLERYTHIYPVIILDSPQSGELSKTNLERMFNFLNNHFSRNQIIIASIHKLNNYSFWKRYKNHNSIINLDKNTLNID